MLLSQRGMERKSSGLPNGYSLDAKYVVINYLNHLPSVVTYCLPTH
jgi:hypothetical protein